jgi:hypothetical protein
VAANDTSFIIAKAEKIEMTEGKETVAFRCGTRISYVIIERFKKRTIMNGDISYPTVSK